MSVNIGQSVICTVYKINITANGIIFARLVTCVARSFQIMLRQMI